jgi:hypothetical protein
MRNICLFRFSAVRKHFLWIHPGFPGVRPGGQGVPVPSRRTTAAGILPWARSQETSPHPLGSARFPAPLDWHGQPLQPKEFPEGPSFVSAPQHRFVFGRAVGVVAEDAGEVVGGIDLQPRQQDQTIVTSRIARSMERPQPVSARWVGCGPGLLAAWCPCRSARGFPGTGTLRNVGFPPSTQTFSASGHQPAGD